MKNKLGEFILSKDSECLVVNNEKGGAKRKGRTLFEAYRKEFKDSKLNLPKGSLSAGT